MSRTYPTLSAIPHKDECDYWPVCGTCDGDAVSINRLASAKWNGSAWAWLEWDDDIRESQFLFGWCVDCKATHSLVWTSNWEGEE